MSQCGLCRQRCTPRMTIVCVGMIRKVMKSEYANTKDALYSSAPVPSDSHIPQSSYDRYSVPVPQPSRDGIPSIIFRPVSSILRSHYISIIICFCFYVNALLQHICTCNICTCVWCACAIVKMSAVICDHTMSHDKSPNETCTISVGICGDRTVPILHFS